MITINLLNDDGGNLKARKKIIKIISWVLLCVSAFFLVYFFGLWKENYTNAIMWNPGNFNVDDYSGKISFMDWSTMDMSTISTIIPLFGTAIIALGFLRIAMANENSSLSSKYFPFFKEYANFTVILGLIGTVWGLIMIGYYDPNKVKMAHLVICMRTALYSTMVALIWVFIIAMPVGKIMRWMRSNIVKPMPKIDMVRDIRRLKGAVSDAADAFIIAKDDAKGFINSMIVASGHVKMLGSKAAEAANDFDDVCSSTLPDFKDATESVKSLIESQRALVEKVVAELKHKEDKNTQILNDIREILGAKEEKLDEFLAEARKLIETANSAQRSASESKERISRALKVLQDGLL